LEAVLSRVDTQGCRGAARRLRQICKEALTAAAYFSQENHDVLHNLKVNLIVNDGRNYVFTTNKQSTSSALTPRIRPAVTAGYCNQGILRNDAKVN